MKYIYFYSTENTDFESNYMFGRFSYTTNLYTPVNSVYSDSLTDWDDHTHHRALVVPPIAWGVSEDTTIEEFLSLPTTYTAKSPKEFKTKYPELFI